MKRYLIFAGHDYYPRGGAADFIGSADTEEEIQALVAGYNPNHHWVNRIDTRPRGVNDKPATTANVCEDMLSVGEWEPCWVDDDGYPRGFDANR